MNHSNLKVIVDVRNKHPYGVVHRLQFFAHNAGKKLVLLASGNSRNVKTYAIVNI